MKLLIATQIVDKNHPVLGFFHGWLKEFAAQVTEIQVIALEVGEYDLPDNVVVHSLGKETKPVSTLVYGYRLMAIAWRLRKNYDQVFVHMIPEYVLAGTPIWWWSKKPVSLWYAHGNVSLLLRLASVFTNTIFTSTEQGCQLKNTKVKIVGQGIDPEQFAFQPRPLCSGVKLITVGRISRIKNLDLCIAALQALKLQGQSVELSIAGDAVDAAGEQYRAELETQVARDELEATVHFLGNVAHDGLPAVLGEHDILLNLSSTGSLDKVILEAALAGVLVVTSNDSGVALLNTVGVPGACKTDAAGAQAAIEQLLTLPESELYTVRQQLRQHVADHHALPALVSRIVDHHKSY